MVGAKAIALQAGVTAAMLRNAPSLHTVATRWQSCINAVRTELSQPSNPLPVVLAAHNGHALDFKVLTYGLDKAIGSAESWMNSIGVVSILDTLRLVNHLPGSVRELLPATEGGGRKSGKNEHLFATLVPHEEQRKLGKLSWHHAYDDAVGTAAWLQTSAVVRVLTTLCEQLRGDTLVSLRQALAVARAKQ